jgi:hypothetical protein
LRGHIGGRLRTLHGIGGLVFDRKWVREPGISEQQAEEIGKASAFGACHPGFKPVVCPAIAQTRGITRTDIHRASLALEPAENQAQARDDI